MHILSSDNEIRGYLRPTSSTWMIPRSLCRRCYAIQYVARTVLRTLRRFAFSSMQQVTSGGTPFWHVYGIAPALTHAMPKDSTLALINKFTLITLEVVFGVRDTCGGVIHKGISSWFTILIKPNSSACCPQERVLLVRMPRSVYLGAP